MTEGRVCKKCGEFHSWDNFSWKRSKRYSDNPEAEIHQLKQPKCKPCAAQDTKEWNEKHKHSARDRYLKRTYGISEKEYNAMLVQQNNSCKICYTEFTNEWGPKAPVVDHCHTTGDVRGILCNECNRGLGYFRDDPQALSRAVTYLTGRIESENGDCSCLT